MIVTFKTTWTPRTGVHETPKKSAKSETGQTSEEWVHTRGIILRVLCNFPDALNAIREALAAAPRACPKELYEPA